jgi:hypothetical protein
MPRQEQPVKTGPLYDFAQGLRDLRTAAGKPTYRELSRRAGFSPSALSAAAAGDMLPTLDVTLAYVGACGGDQSLWEQRWRKLTDGVPDPGQRDKEASPETAAAAALRPPGSARPLIVTRFGLAPLLLVVAAITALIIANSKQNDLHVESPAITGPSQNPTVSGSGTSADVTPPQAGYTLVYEDKTLRTKDYNVSIDLTTGRTVDGGGRWLLGTNSGGDGKGAFELQDATDAAIAGQQQPTAQQCVTDITRLPVRDLHFGQVPAGTWFCLRWRLTADVAIVQTLDLDSGNYAVDVTVAYYHRAASPSTTAQLSLPAVRHGQGG